MTAIEFSLIPDTETDYQTVSRLMLDFKRETGVDVHLAALAPLASVPISPAPQTGKKETIL